MYLHDPLTPHVEWSQFGARCQEWAFHPHYEVMLILHSGHDWSKQFRWEFYYGIVHLSSVLVESSNL